MRILVTVVRYKMPLSESPTIQGLLQTFASQPDLHASLSVLVWDNSPTPLEDTEPLSKFIYRHSPRNLGVSGAYNRAMDLAAELDCSWLLLLDQDTEIPADFLPHMINLGNQFLHQSAIAAVVPFQMDGDRILSPLKVLFKRLRPLDQPFEGVYPGEISAANSGTLIRLDALRLIGGFNEDFWLDYSDVVVFHRLHQLGKQTYIAGALRLQHKNTAVDFSNSMTPERYASFLAAEGAYWDTCRTVVERAFHTLRTLERAIRQKRLYPNRPFAAITFKCFLRRLFLSRKRRLQGWKLQSLQRNMPR